MNAKKEKEESLRRDDDEKRGKAICGWEWGSRHGMGRNE
jgi:hypothetical protein